MTKKTVIALLLGGILAYGPASAQDEPIYGYQLMSPLERAEYKAEMRSLETEEERDEFLQEHRELMDERAQEEGITLTDNGAPAQGE